MGCHRPLTMYRTEQGEVSFSAFRAAGTLQVRCGRCIGCRIDNREAWVTRCQKEAQLYGANNSFITLTYNDENLPDGAELVPRDLQLFFKRLRQKVAPTRIRHFSCGEYGSASGRPHYHAIIFGYWFPDRTEWSRSRSTFRSATLEECWQLGSSVVGNATVAAMRYVAGYVMKKADEEKALVNRRWIDPDTGEVTLRGPEFSRMSRRPGIGRDWLEKYHADVYGGEFDGVVVDGRKRRVPRYFDRIYERMGEREALNLSEIKAHRELLGFEQRADNTDARREVKERIARALMEQKTRGL